MDAQFELVSVLVNVALWHMKHAAHLAANPELEYFTRRLLFFAFTVSLQNLNGRGKRSASDVKNRRRDVHFVESMSIRLL